MRPKSLVWFSLLAFVVSLALGSAVWAAPKPPKGGPKTPKAGPAGPKLPKAGPKPPRGPRPKLVKPGVKRPLVVRPRPKVVHKRRLIVVKPGGPIVVAAPLGVLLPPPPPDPVQVVVKGKTKYVTIPQWTGELKEGQTYQCTRYISSTGRHEVLLYTQDPDADFDVYIKSPMGRVFASGEEVGGELVTYDVRRPGELAYEVVAKRGGGLFMLKLN
jgi:hypothetical protein